MYIYYINNWENDATHENALLHIYFVKTKVAIGGVLPIPKQNKKNMI